MQWISLKDAPSGSWISVTERLPTATEYPFEKVLVWVVYGLDVGCVMIASVRGRFSRRDEDDLDLVYIDGFNFQWSGGDNDRTWPQDTSFLGEGGYGVDDGEDRITHWMPLPKAPE